LSYDLKNCLENLSKDQNFKIKTPALWLINFHLVLEFDHDKKHINCLASSQLYFDKIPQISAASLKEKFKISDIKSNFSKLEYLQKVRTIKEKIINGDLYQANLTRKFYGEITVKNKFAIFLKLNKVSPGNHSAFLKLKDNYIISSS